jgi:hypothetical protein
MSSALAIAGVTQILRDILNDGLIDADVSGMLGGNVNVRTRAPDVVEEMLTDTDSAVNLFLHRVSPNTGLSNEMLPTRDASGNRIANTPLALDLHYLLSAYGGAELHAEILLGYAMQILHEHPVITRAEIHAALDALPAIGGDLPPALQSLGATRLADQLELIRITPVYMTLDEQSKLWTACQASMRSSATYTVTVALIDVQQPGVRPLPVLTLGPGNSGVDAEPNLIPPYPMITGIALPAGQPSARLGDAITVTGRHLDGAPVSARFSNIRFAAPIVVPVAAADISASAVRITIPNTPPAWGAGPFTVELDVKKPIEPNPRRTNGFGLSIAPRMTLPPIAIARAGDGSVTVDLGISPRVRPGQVVTLSIGSREATADALPAPADQLRFRFDTLPPGNQASRLRLDGVDSWLIDRTKTPPVFDPTQFIVVPP